MSQKIMVDRPVNNEILYNIAEIFWQADSWRQALDRIIKIARSQFIFDNIVLYLIDPMTMNLEVAYAKATGRGKSAEADVAWGEIIGNKVIESRQKILQEPSDTDQQNRLIYPYTLGLPIHTNQEMMGAIIFIRFGGPIYTEADITLAEFLSQQLSLQIQREWLKRDRDHLEFQYRTFQVQEDFISTVSHELRNPLGFIKGYTTTLLREDVTWDEKTQNEFLMIIDQEADRLQDLIENLLDSAKLQSGQIVMNFQAMRLDALINDLLVRTRLHHPGLKLFTRVKSPIRTVTADPRRIAQIIENLVGNAVKYAPGSPVYITIDETKTGVIIEVRDEGPGIPEKYLDHIFNRFFRVPDQRPNVHGSGLGLFICKQIIQAHNGDIRIKSRLGEGTTFIIELPNQP